MQLNLEQMAKELAKAKQSLFKELILTVIENLSKRTDFNVNAKLLNGLLKKNAWPTSNYDTKDVLKYKSIPVSLTIDFSVVEHYDNVDINSDVLPAWITRPTITLTFPTIEHLNNDYVYKAETVTNLEDLIADLELKVIEYNKKLGEKKRQDLKDKKGKS